MFIRLFCVDIYAKQVNYQLAIELSTCHRIINLHQNIHPNMHQNQPKLHKSDNYSNNGVPLWGYFVGIFIKQQLSKIINKFNNFQKSDNYARNGGHLWVKFHRIFQIMGGMHPSGAFWVDNSKFA